MSSNSDPLPASPQFAVANFDLPPQAGEGKSNAIVARGLTRRFGKVTAVDALDLTVGRAQVYGFLGPNGSGKTTAIRMLCGLLLPSAGTIDVLGFNIPEQAEALKRRIGYMTQKFSLYDDLTVRENLLVVRGVAHIKRRMDEVLADFPALVERLPQPASNLSGGERQQLAFARALMPSPRIMVLDEPTAALAPSLVGKVFDMVQKLPAAGVAVLMVEQRARQALQISQQGYILDQGSCVLQGPAQGLLADERMAQLYLGNH